MAAGSLRQQRCFYSGRSELAATTNRTWRSTIEGLLHVCPERLSTIFAAANLKKPSAQTASSCLSAAHSSSTIAGFSPATQSCAQPPSAWGLLQTCSICCVWRSAPTPLGPKPLALPERKACPCSRRRTARFALKPSWLYSACSAPSRSVTLAVVTATACGSPCVSTAMWRLMPETFLPASYPLSFAVPVFLTL